MSRSNRPITVEAQTNNRLGSRSILNRIVIRRIVLRQRILNLLLRCNLRVCHNSL